MKHLRKRVRPKRRSSDLEEKQYVASQWQLMWRKFKKHRIAMTGGSVLIVLYLIAIFCEFLAPYDPHRRFIDYVYAPPQRLHFFDEQGFNVRPFFYSLKREIDEETLLKTYKEDKNKKYSLSFFTRGDRYKFWAIFETDLHLFGVDNGSIFLFGADRMGRDMLSRILYASRISLSVGLIGVFLSLIIGAILGGISGYYGGMVDTIIQRIIEVIRSFPTIPLWMGLSAALPPHWPVLKVYFGIVVILSFIGWTNLARVVRGKLLVLREEDFAMAARLAGCKEIKIITRHLLPNFLSYIIVSVSLAIPGMILGETSLSFLGLGLRPPVISWGALLKEAQNVRTLAFNPWLLIPAIFVIITVLAFNFLGDGLRDSADPYR